jgi:hypothetical protein
MRWSDELGNIYEGEKYQEGVMVKNNSHKHIPSPIYTRYEELGIKVGALVDKKQAAYGDSFSKAGNVLRLMYPNGISTGQYDDMLCLVRIIDKLFRIATDRDALGESPFQDVVGYALLGLNRVECLKDACEAVQQVVTGDKKSNGLNIMKDNLEDI